MSSPRSPLLHDHETGNTSSGLYRIRQSPAGRIYPVAGTPTQSISRSSSTLSPTIQPLPRPISPAQRVSSAPLTPGAPLVGEDLTRFPSESLHSFSFANQSDDLIHSRHNILKRSIDFMRDKIEWAAGGLGIARAKAEISGDPEMQSMVELLMKAKLLHHEGKGQIHSLSPGPLTGPVQSRPENVFEQSFSSGGQSSTAVSNVLPKTSNQNGPPDSPSQPVELSMRIKTSSAQLPTHPTSAAPMSQSSEHWIPNRRASLKRTFTDIAPISLQSKLTDALAKPFVASEYSTISPVAPTPTIGGALTNGQSFPSFASHARAAPSAQAIFTTEANAPWTTTAANDLACLVFGLSKAEVRKASILEMFRQDKREWLKSVLEGPQSSPASSSWTASRRASVAQQKPLLSGSGVTARLLNKPPAWQQGQLSRSHSDDTAKSDGLQLGERTFRSDQNMPKSRGVIMCGDVLPILKRNGAIGSATLWVQEKRGSLIWVLEEIAEDVAILQVDEIGSVVKVTGKSEAIWGMERVRRGMDVTRLLPSMPRIKGTNTGALDYDAIANLRRFTARTANDINIPVTIDQVSGKYTFQISSFPHIAGMMVLSASTLEVCSSNSRVSEALFGQSLNGRKISTIVPNFDKMLELLADEDDVQLTEGTVIPEHGFRRARALLAVREGNEDAAAVFLRPSGLPAIHRDGAEIMIDVQMRVLKSDLLGQGFQDGKTKQATNMDDNFKTMPTSKVVYVLWVTYSRVLHAANHGHGRISPLISRPGTPPQQPPPDDLPSDVTDESDVDDNRGSKAISILSRKQSHAVPRPTAQAASGKSQLPVSPSNTDQPHKKQITDFIILEDMGAGAYGQVKLARPKSSLSAAKVVLKYVTKRRILVDTWTRDRRLGTVPLEIHVLDYLRRLNSSGVSHPNIVEMCDFFEDDVNYYIEMVPHGLPGMDLFDYIELRVNMGEDECRAIFQQVAGAVEFLHESAKVVHRDIKDENVILDGDGIVKLVDFGSASYVKNGPFDVFVGTIGKLRLRGRIPIQKYRQLTEGRLRGP